MVRKLKERKEKVKIKGKGKYNGKRQIELEKELGLPADTEIFYTVEEVNEPEKKIRKKNEEDRKEHAFEEIAKLAKHFGRSDLSERHHEILGDLIE